MRNSFTRLILCVPISLACYGCGHDGPETVPVAGSVKYDGVPIDAGEIRFLPEDGRGTLEVGPIQNGKYDLQVTPGHKRVEVRAPKQTDIRIKTPIGPGQFMESPPIMQETIPEKYNSKSTLTAEVVAGGNELNFDLEKGIAPPSGMPPRMRGAPE